MRSGMAFLGEDRKEMGIYSGRSVLINMMVPGKPASSSPLLRIDRIGEYKAAAELTRRLDIRYHDLDQDIAELSGGNQQKALIGRWLHCEADVFLLDEPTTGLDVTVQPPSEKGGRQISADLEELVMRALAKNPERRPASAEEVARRDNADLNPGNVNSAEINSLKDRPR